MKCILAFLDDTNRLILEGKHAYTGIPPKYKNIKFLFKIPFFDPYVLLKFCDKFLHENGYVIIHYAGIRGYALKPGAVEALIEYLQTIQRLEWYEKVYDSRARIIQFSPQMYECNHIVHTDMLLIENFP